MPSLNKILPKIDKVDKNLIKLISKRFNLTEQVAYSKLNSGETIHQNSRWQEVLKKLESQAKSKKLSYPMLEKIWNEIHEESKSQQERIIKNAKKN